MGAHESGGCSAVGGAGERRGGPGAGRGPRAARALLRALDHHSGQLRLVDCVFAFGVPDAVAQP